MSDKSHKDIENKVIEKMSSAGTFLEQMLGEVSKKSATKQIVIGGVSGWVTGFVTMKVGKSAAFLIGGSIIVLQVASEQGLIRVDWNKVTRGIDRVGDRVEEAVTGEGPKWMDKAERFVDRKLDQAESALKKKTRRAKKWYSSLIGDENGARLNELHIFAVAFGAGVFLGFASS